MDLDEKGGGEELRGETAIGIYCMKKRYLFLIKGGKSYIHILNVYYCFSFVHLHVLCVYLGPTEVMRASDGLELELCVILSHRVGTGN